MFKLQALQADMVTWYTISEHTTRNAADEMMRSRPAWRYGRVRYRIVRE